MMAATSSPVLALVLLLSAVVLVASGQQYVAYNGRSLDYTLKQTTFSYTVTPVSSSTVTSFFLAIPSTYHVIKTSAMSWVTNGGSDGATTGLSISCSITTATTFTITLWGAYTIQSMKYYVQSSGTPFSGDTTGPYVSPAAPVTTAPSTITLTAVVRDYSTLLYRTTSDFEYFGGSGLKGLVRSTLGDDGLPVFSTTPPATWETHLHGADSFYQWYRDNEGPSGKSYKFEVPLVFNKKYDDPPEYVYESSAFFPLDGICNVTGKPQCWGIEKNNNNFAFTTQITTTFTYHGGEAFSFSGDDDVWVFIDGTLAVDLGGMHGPLTDSVQLDSLKLTKNKTYSMSLFHAERHTGGSNFMATTSIMMEQCYNKDEFGFCSSQCIPDSDGDNVPDCLDGCVSDPLKTSPGLCGCSGKMVNCDDSKKCTIDTCEEGTGCVHKENKCDDGNACTSDSCDATDGCSHKDITCTSPDPCKIPSCDPTSGCVLTPMVCNDNSACTEDVCVAGKCTFTPITCNDHLACTDDTCSKATGCVFTPKVCLTESQCYEKECIEERGGCVKRDCDDHDDCTADYCNKTVGCLHPPKKCGACDLNPINCSDAEHKLPCYDAECEPVSATNKTSMCRYTHWNTTRCLMEDKCIIGYCDPTTETCKNTHVVCDPKPCQVATCNSATGVCDYQTLCISPSPCQKSVCNETLNACIVSDDDTVCEDKACQIKSCSDDGTFHANCSYTLKVCNSGSKCVDSKCDMNTNQCVESKVDCNDNKECTTDSCDGETGCSNVPVTCYDGNPCTNDTCVEGKGCVFPKKCNDGKFCTQDTCRASGQCEYPEVDCSDDDHLNLTYDEKKCFTTLCLPAKAKCVKQYQTDVLVDVCGGCVSLIVKEFNLSASSYDADAQCLTSYVTTAVSAALGAAAVAGIVIAAVVAGVIILGTSSVGTYELVKRSRDALNHGLVSNPLYEAKANEGTNPMFDNNSTSIALSDIHN